MNTSTVLETRFEEFYPAVRRYLTRRVFDPELADELTAETFFRAACRLDRLPSDPQRTQMWLYRVANNVMIGYFRKTTSTRALLGRLSAIRQSAQTPPADLLVEDNPAQLRELLRDLPANHQSVISLRYLARLPFDEIATILECRKTAVRVRLSRAMKCLRMRARQTTAA